MSNLRCISCDKELESNHSPYLGKLCHNCYVKAKQKQKAMAGTYITKEGTWVCENCERTHSKKKLFCWECGDSQENATWISL
jgi:phage FluMu protein Com